MKKGNVLSEPKRLPTADCKEGSFACAFIIKMWCGYDDDGGGGGGGGRRERWRNLTLAPIFRLCTRMLNIRPAACSR